MFDMSNLYAGFNALYDEAYEASDEVEWFDRGLGVYEIVAQTRGEVLKDFVKMRGDFLTSDRECAAFGETVYRMVYGL